MSEDERLENAASEVAKVLDTYKVSFVYQGETDDGEHIIALECLEPEPALH